MTLIKPIHAAIKNPLLPDTIHIDQPKTYFNNVIQTIFTIFFIVAVLYFIWHVVMAGYHLMDSRGDAKKLEESKTELTNAFIGITVIFSIFALLKFVGIIFGLDGLQQLQIPWPDLL